MLSGETIAYLKQPTFDMWNWEPNEMLALLEHMYTDLNLTTEFKINVMVLKKWLVRVFCFDLKFLKFRAIVLM